MFWWKKRQHTRGIIEKETDRHHTAVKRLLFEPLFNVYNVHLHLVCALCSIDVDLIYLDRFLWIELYSSAIYVSSLFQPYCMECYLSIVDNETRIWSNKIGIFCLYSTEFHLQLLCMKLVQQVNRRYLKCIYSVTNAQNNNTIKWVVLAFI